VKRLQVDSPDHAVGKARAAGFEITGWEMLESVTGVPQKEPKRTGDGFTLVEVLLALAMAALGFGVILHTVGLQMSLVANCLDRHQMLLYASQVLETNMAKGLTEEKVTDAEISSKDMEPEEGEEDLEVAPRFVYGLESNPVTADPRVQQVTASIKGRNSGIRLSAYRLRVKRD
jgi:prepilin-type N-terminal cleavage/methylation domain-containing protein